MVASDLRSRVVGSKKEHEIRYGRRSRPNDNIVYIYIYDINYYHYFIIIIISLLRIFQTGSGVQQTSYPMGNGGFSPTVNRPGREADHSPPASAEVKKMWIYTSTPS
jgi:hypothetical protein